MCILNCTQRIGAFGLVSLSPSFDSDISPAGHQQSVCALTFGILEMIYFAEGYCSLVFLVARWKVTRCLSPERIACLSWSSLTWFCLQGEVQIYCFLPLLRKGIYLQKYLQRYINSWIGTATALALVKCILYEMLERARKAFWPHDRCRNPSPSSFCLLL